MRLKMVAVLFTAVVTVALVGSASAQGMFEPGNSSAQQVIDDSSPTVQSPSQTLVSRPGLRLMGLGMLWSSMAWAPASPLYSPSMLGFVTSDRRWGLR